MLLRFTVENLHCFAEETIFSMVAGKDAQHPEHVMTLREGYRHKALRTAALYGANAHGKTKLVEALALARGLIVRGSKPGQALPIVPFRLDAEKRRQASRFEFVIFHQGIEYTYGFVANGKQILEEWLFARPHTREVRYFERVTDLQGQTKIEFGASLKSNANREVDFLEFVARGTRANQLFLTEAVERNVKSLQPVYEWFDEVLTLVPTNRSFQPLELRACEENDFIGFMGKFLRLADTGIDAIVADEESLDIDRHFSNLPQALKDKLVADLNQQNAAIIGYGEDGDTVCLRQGDNGPILARLRAGHRDQQGEFQFFDIQDESAGTRRILQILPILADLKSSNRVYVINELDRKLHPLLSRLLVSQFLEMGKGQQCQMIFTTHETHLLDLKLLRRDEIWFVEKDQAGVSHLYSLSDLNIRPDLKIERGYLHGRFGAIPFFGNTEALSWS